MFRSPSHAQVQEAHRSFACLYHVAEGLPDGIWPSQSSVMMELQALSTFTQSVLILKAQGHPQKKEEKKEKS